MVAPTDDLYMLNKQEFLTSKLRFHSVELDKSNDVNCWFLLITA